VLGHFALAKLLLLSLQFVHPQVQLQPLLQVEALGRSGSGEDKASCDNEGCTHGRVSWP
jgi:hypothetical protein